MHQVHEDDHQQQHRSRAVQGQVPRRQELARSSSHRGERTCTCEDPWRDPRHFLREVWVFRCEAGLRAGRAVPRASHARWPTSFGEDQAWEATLVRSGYQGIQACTRRHDPGLEQRWQTFRWRGAEAQDDEEEA